MKSLIPMIKTEEETFIQAQDSKNKHQNLLNKDKQLSDVSELMEETMFGLFVTNLFKNYKLLDHN